MGGVLKKSQIIHVGTWKQHEIAMFLPVVMRLALAWAHLGYRLPWALKSTWTEKQNIHLTVEKRYLNASFKACKSTLGCVDLYGYWWIWIKSHMIIDVNKSWSSFQMWFHVLASLSLGDAFLYSFHHWIFFKTKNNSIIPLPTLYSAVLQNTPFVLLLFVHKKSLVLQQWTFYIKVQSFDSSQRVAYVSFVHVSDCVFVYLWLCVCRRLWWFCWFLVVHWC